VVVLGGSLIIGFMIYDFGFRIGGSGKCAQWVMAAVVMGSALT
jgi:hypothetical protein